MLLSTMLAWSAIAAKPVLAAADGDPATTTITSNAASFTAGGSATITVQVNDAAGDPVAPGGTDVVTLSTTIGSITNLTDHGDSTWTATLSSTEAGSAIVSGTVNSQPITDTESVTVDPGPAAKLAFVDQPPGNTADQTFSTSVEVVDTYGNRVPDATNTVDLSLYRLGSPSSLLIGDASNDATAGLASFSNLAIHTADSGYTIKAASAGLTGAESDSFDITHGVATKLRLREDLDSSPYSADSDLTLEIDVADQYDNVVDTGAAASASITLALSGGDAAGFIEEGPTYSAGDGVAHPEFHIRKPGSDYKITGSSGSLTGFETSPFDIVPGALEHYTWDPISQQTAGTSFEIRVTAYDAYGNVKTNYDGTTAALESNLGNAPSGDTPTVPLNLTWGEDTGVGTATVTAVKTTAYGTPYAQTQHFTVTDGDVTKLSDDFGVKPAGLDHFGWDDIAQQTAGTSFSISATAYDEFDNVKTDYTGSSASLTSNLGASPNSTTPTVPGNLTWGTGTGVGSADVTAVDATAYGTPYAKTQHFTITDGSVSKHSDDFGVAPAALDHFTWASISQQTAGTSFAISATAYDAYGNVKTNYTGTGASLTSTLGNSPSGATPTLPANLTWGAGTGIGSANVTAVKATAFGTPYTASETFTITASSADGSKTATSGAFAVIPATSTALSFGTTALNGTFAGGQPIDTKVNSVIYSSCAPAASGSADPCLATSVPVKVLATDAYGNRKAGVTIGVTRQAVPTSGFAGTFTGTISIATANGSGTTPLGEAWFSDLKMTTISGTATDRYTLTAAASGATNKVSSSFRIVSDLANCSGQLKCFNNTKNNSVATPENSYTQTLSTNGTFGNVVATTNFSNPALDVDSKCTNVRPAGKSIGSAIDVRISGDNLGTTQPTTTMVMIIPLKTLKFYGLTSRNADAYNVCLGALYLDSGTATAWTGKDAKNKALLSVASNDADGLLRYWGVPADCGQKFLHSTDPCISLKSKSASAVASQLTKVTGTTWTVSKVNSDLNYFDGDIAIFITKPWPWDSKGAGY